MKRFYLLQCVLFFSANMLIAQYTDYIGAGHDINVTVTSCDDQTRPNWTQTASASNTVNGSGFYRRYYDAGRFLAQATFGKNIALIQSVENMGYEAWIDQQMALPIKSMLQSATEKNDEVTAHKLSLGYPIEDAISDLSDYDFNMAWFDNAVNQEDQLRQRVALALSEILVISNNSNLGGYGEASASYYDIFLEEAFGNYGDVLRRVTLHPAMGFYLSHYNNPKTDLVAGTHPDENYAREVMQLFSIGLYQLNQDGSRVLDQGDFVPTYSQEDIKELAKVLTGLGAGAVNPENDYEDVPYFGLYFGSADLTEPMVMYDEYHEPGPKSLLNGYTLQGNLDGMSEVIGAINNLFNHPNVAPFISRQLIQKLVKSNPTPNYISRVANVFNNNGQGVRGDMAAVVKSILLDEEARDCSWINNPINGKLKEPIVKFTEYYRAFEFNNPSGYLWNPGYNYKDDTDQYPMLSPSVFNFFTPNYQPNGPISSNGLVAPEFQILQTRTSMGYINWVNTWSQGGYPFWQWEEEIENIQLDITQLKQMARDPEVLINYLDMVLVNGNMSQATRDIISDALYTFEVTDDDPADFYYLEYRAELGLYLTMISPDYNILK